MGETTPTSGPGRRSSADELSQDMPAAGTTAGRGTALGAVSTDIFELAKNVGTLLGTSTVVAYAAGYLALRTRALVLGLDPSFKLVDEIYVFAGFRLLLTVLIVLLIAAPLLWLMQRGIGAVLLKLDADWQIRAQWLALIGVTAMTLYSLKMLSLTGILLGNESFAEPGLAQALLVW